jgi:hypothetical protein
MPGLGAIEDVMAGHSRPMDGVLSLAYVPAIHVLLSRRKTWMPGTRPGMTLRALSGQPNH